MFTQRTNRCEIRSTLHWTDVALRHRCSDQSSRRISGHKTRLFWRSNEKTREKRVFIRLNQMLCSSSCRRREIDVGHGLFNQCSAMVNLTEVSFFELVVPGQEKDERSSRESTCLCQQAIPEETSMTCSLVEIIAQRDSFVVKDQIDEDPDDSLEQIVVDATRRRRRERYSQSDTCPSVHRSEEDKARNTLIKQRDRLDSCRGEQKRRTDL